MVSFFVASETHPSYVAFSNCIAMSAKEGKMFNKSAKGGFLLVRWFFQKPTKPSARPNQMALKASRRHAPKGSTPELQNVVRLSMQNDARLSQ
jgi:hypothetical protein